MTITVSDDADALTELLWVREAWALNPPGPDLPPRPSDLPAIPESVQGLRRDKQEWEHAWTELWFAALEHLAKPNDPDIWDALRASKNGSPERMASLDALAGPHWSTRFGHEPFDGVYRTWVEELAAQTSAGLQIPLEQQPERACLDALIPAWERGLTTIIPIPCSGTYNRTISGSAIAVTRATRTDPSRFRAALDQFGNS